MGEPPEGKPPVSACVCAYTCIRAHTRTRVGPCWRVLVHARAHACVRPCVHRRVQAGGCPRACSTVPTCVCACARPVCTRVCARPLCSHSPPTPGPCLLGVPCPRGQGTLCHCCPGTRLGAPPALPLLGCGPEFAINGSAARAARPAAAGLRQSRRPRGCCRLGGGAEDGPAHHTAWNTRVHTCAGPCG